MALVNSVWTVNKALFCFCFLIKRGDLLYRRIENTQVQLLNCLAEGSFSLCWETCLLILTPKLEYARINISINRHLCVCVETNSENKLSWHEFLSVKLISHFTGHFTWNHHFHAFLYGCYSQTIVTGPGYRWTAKLGHDLTLTELSTHLVTFILMSD